MTFPWQTEKARRKQEADEDLARRALADLMLREAEAKGPSPQKTMSEASDG